MKQNILQNMIKFIFKYIWIFCAMLVILEMASVIFTTSILMQQSALGVMQSVSGDVTGRVEGVLRLLQGMASDERFADTSKPIFDRVIQAMPYQNSFNLYMIAITDEEINVVSADETEPPKENFSLAYRDYMQRLYATGRYQITDAFLSGDGKGTMNYTIAVPIEQQGKVVGSVFGSIYFKDVEDILHRQSQNNGCDFYLLGADNTIMAGDNGQINGESFLNLSGKNFIFNDNAERINASMKDGISGDFWELDEEGLTYVTYQRVAPTDWTLLYRVQFWPVFAKLFPTLCIKICFYILVSAAIFIFGRRYLSRQLAQVNHMLNRMAAMQKELFQSEQPDYDNLLELTQQGLTDQLTGLSTRALMFSRLASVSAPCGAVALIDLDDLKSINDHYGHEGGDCALIYFAQILKSYEQKYNGIAARYGGDEFILVLSGTDRETAASIIQELRRNLNASISCKEHTFSIHASIGMSFYPEHGVNFEELICKADLALYEAKQRGKNMCICFVENLRI